MDVKRMREILFRGKRIDNGEWVEGYFVNLWLIHYHKYQPIITDNNAFSYDVDPSTVCQYTGICDKNGKKIFEGDIVRHYNHSVDTEKYEVGKVFFDSHSACFKCTSNPGAVYLGRRCTYEIIGNIHDNPELLEVNNDCLIEPCEICENFIKGAKCSMDMCPVGLMKAENIMLKKETIKLKKKISELKNEISYMTSPNIIGDRHEMGSW